MIDHLARHSAVDADVFASDKSRLIGAKIKNHIRDIQRISHPSRRLLNGVSSVKLFGEEIAVCAEIASLHGTSGHADQQGLLNWLGGFQEKPRQIFVNHGDDASCENFRALLASLGYSALAPYSGTEFDLLAGKLTAYTDGVKIDREAAFKGSQRARQVYSELVSAAEDLLALVKTRRGRTNKDNAKLTAQIRSLIEKWRSN